MSKNIDFSVRVMDDNFTLFRSKSEDTLEKLLPQIFQASGHANEPFNMDEFVLLKAVQITDLKGMSLQDLRINPGDYLCLVYKSALMAGCKLIVLDQEKPEIIPVRKQDSLIGRRDEDRNIFPDIDLTRYLKNPNKLSRQQALLIEQEGKWTIQLHPDAKSTVFVNQDRLEIHHPVELHDEDVLIFGPSPMKPELSIQVRLSQ